MAAELAPNALPAAVDERCPPSGEEDEDFQGPYSWRQRLRPVKSPTNGTEEPDSESNACEADNEVQRVKERLRCDDHPIIATKRENNPSVPSWSRALKDKKGKSHQNSASGIPVFMRRRTLVSHVDSPFKQQVVNLSTVSMIPRRRVSPSNSFKVHTSSSVKRTPSIHNLTENSSTVVLSKKKIEKVRRARLYLLQQFGPSSFLIGTDSPDLKFRVNIGPQHCNCGRGPVCIHVLFIMLRVFQVPDTDPLLWNKTLKNFEVETLIHTYHKKRIKRMKSLDEKRLQPRKSASDVADNESQETLSIPSETDTGSCKEEEEDMCPICLLEMLDGESVLRCEDGCQNRLHQHCIAVWFEECKRQNEALNCPMCRTKWKINENDLMNPAAPPNTRASSPVSVLSGQDLRLPYTEPIPEEHREIATPWIQVLGEEVVACLFSRNWSIRETALKHLSREAVATLLRGAGEGRSGIVVSQPRLETTHQMLECGCSILAFMCCDPVYRVFVSCLKTLRAILLYTPCREEAQRTRLQILLKPSIDAILLKCTDGNRRTSQLSISTIMELAKGQDGELAIGREIVNPGTNGLGGVVYVVRAVTETYNMDTVQWQWLLGRLYVLHKLLEEFPRDFKPPSNKNGIDCHEVVNTQSGNDEDSGTPTSKKCDVSINVLKICQFCAYAICHTHLTISKVSRHVFIKLVKSCLHRNDILVDIYKSLDCIEPNIATSMKRKLNKLRKHFQAVAQGSPVETPTETPRSTPRCNSPATTQSDSHSEAAVSNIEIIGQIVPPNTPRHRNVRRVGVSESGSEDEMGGGSDLEHTIDITLSYGFPTPPYTPQNYAVRKASNLSTSSISEQASDNPEICQNDETLLPNQNDDDSLVFNDEADVYPVSPRPTVLCCVDSFDEDLAANSSCINDSRVSNGVSSEEMTDVSITSPCTDQPVSFVTEVTSTTPKTSPNNSVEQGPTDDCPCKEEVEMEEAVALAKALDVSHKQEPVPMVPGLTPTPGSGEEVICIHIQPENGSEHHDPQPQTYFEGIHWKRGRLIGTGAFSTCYQARDTATGVLMAVKQISFCRNSPTEQEAVVDAITEEIHMMARLNHPNIIRIMGATRQGCHFNMFAEWMPGGTIAGLLGQYGVFSEEVIINYLKHIVRGLTYLHDNKILHRDLKGANLLIDSTGQRLRIGDFGASARLASQATAAGEFQGQLLGTITFMAPEVLRGDCYGRACDIWSVGCCAIEMATTKPPWSSPDVYNHLALIYKIATTVTPPPIPEHLSPAMRDIMLRCLELSPGDRPAAKDLLLHALFTHYSPS